MEKIDETVMRILEYMSDAFVCLDSDWRYTYVNRKAGELFHRDPESLIGKHIWTEFPEGVGQKFHLAYERAVSEGRTLQIEEWYPPWQRWFENRIHPQPGCLGIFFNDVTDRRRMVDALRREITLRTQAGRMASLGFWEYDVAADRVTWSDEMYRIHGLDPTTLPTTMESFLALVHPADRGAVQAAIDRAVREGESFMFEHRTVRPDGDVRSLRTWGTTEAGVGGQTAAAFGVCLDMTELIRTTEGLRRSEEWLEIALDATSIALWEWDVAGPDPSTGRMVWSRGLERVLGMTAGSFAGTYDALLARATAADRARVDEDVKRLLRSGNTLATEYAVLTERGEERRIAARARVFRDGDGRAVRVASSLVDVTEQRQAEEQRRIAEARLVQAQKMEALGRLAAGVAHDFNNLLTVIESTASLLTRPGRSEETLRVDVDQIRAAARRAGELTRQLLALSRQQVFAIGVHDIDLIAGDMARMLARALPPTIELRTALNAHGSRVRVDRGQLEQVILNLAVNARDAMPEGGTLTIATGTDVGQVVLEVRDTGTGMDQDVQSHVFEPFYTTKGESGGTGLGLAMAYGIVTQSGGRIEVTSAPGAGSAFSVLLPRVDDNR